MPSGFDFKKLRRLIKIYAVVQIALVALLLYVALLFQTNLGPLFWKSILITLVIQLVNFYPVNLFATREARREVAAPARIDRDRRAWDTRGRERSSDLKRITDTPQHIGRIAV